MWEYEVVLFGVGLVLLAITSGVIYVVCHDRNNQNMDEGQHIPDSDSVLRVRDRDRERYSTGNVDNEKIKHLYALAEQIGVTIGGDE